MIPARKAGLPEWSKVFQAQQVIKFSRVNLMPTEQDIYNKDGDMETQVLYGPYQTFNGMLYPSTITINRPLEEYRIALTVEKITFNQPLPDEQFESKVPAGYKVQNMP